MSFLRRPFLLTLLLIAALSAVMHLRIFSTELVGPHAWRQTQTAANIHYFATADGNILHPRVYYLVNGTNLMRMEFPLLQWLIGTAERLTGEHIVIERLLLFLTGVLALAGMGRLAREVIGRVEAAPLAAWTLCFSPLFYYYTMNPLPDLLALCCCTWGMAFFFRWRKTASESALVCCVALLALATLCKLPFIVYYAVFAGWLFTEVRSKTLSLKKLLTVASVAGLSVAAALSWYLVVMREWSPNMVTSGMLNNALSGNEIFEILKGTLVSTLPELLLNFAAVPLFIAGFVFLVRGRKHPRPFLLPLACAGAGVLAYFFFELNAITLVHDYYLMPFLPLLFLIVTYGVWNMIAAGSWLRIAAFVLLAVMPVTAFLRCDSRWDERDPGFNADLVAHRNALRAAVPAGAKIIIGNDPSAHIGLYYAAREGWNFDNDALSPEALQTFIAQGAAYLYSDSRSVENDPKLQAFFGKKIATVGSYSIIALKHP